MNQTQEIIWMMDGAMLKTHPKNWDELRNKSQVLLNTIGNQEYSHKIADPELLIKSLAPKVAKLKPDTILDLSGWMSEALKGLFPKSRIIKDFRLSRIREVSSPSLPTSGHIVSLSKNKRTALSQTIKDDNVIILDDTSFSGSTSEITMNLLNLNPENTSHAFLILNEGKLGDSPGAKRRLESLGSKVFSGMKIHTPIQDGWHFQDVFDHPHIHEGIEISRFLQASIITFGHSSLEISIILTSDLFRELLLSERLEHKEINNLLKEGRVVSDNPSRLLNGEIHTKNPLLWISPYFAEHINIGKLIENSREISQELQSIRDLTDNKINSEAIYEMKRQVEGIMWNKNPERRG